MNPFNSATLEDDEKDIFDEFEAIKQRWTSQAAGVKSLSDIDQKYSVPQAQKTNSTSPPSKSVSTPKIDNMPKSSNAPKFEIVPKASSQPMISQRQTFESGSSIRTNNIKKSGLEYLDIENDIRNRPLKGRHSKLHTMTFLSLPKNQPDSSPKNRAEAISKGAQAAVVKLVSVAGSRSSASAMAKYNSRDGEEPLELETGEIVQSHDDIKTMLDEWEKDFDKREPSKDVVTLRVSFKENLNSEQKKMYEEAIVDYYSDQRIVSGFTVNNDGNTELLAIMSVASKGKGRIKTTDHAKNALENTVQDEIYHEWYADADFSFSQPQHGIEGVVSEFKKALKEVDYLSGAKDQFVDIENIQKSASKWKRDIRSYGNRNVMHLVLSSKAGTDQEAFKKATRDFLGIEFGNHKYAFVIHGPKDQAIDKKTGKSKATDHIHAHVMVLMKGMDGKKLDPRIKDFKHWRETMAFQSRKHGINMVATNRTEHANAPSYSKSEHEQVKSGNADEKTIAKVTAKTEKQAVLPKTNAGIINAQVGKIAVSQVLEEAQKTGNEEVINNANGLLQNISLAIFKIEDNTKSNDTKNIADVINTLQELLTVISENKEEYKEMSKAKLVTTSIDRLKTTTNRISESLNGDPELKASFDKTAKPLMENLDNTVNSNTNSPEDVAIRSRVVEAEADQNADTLEREAIKTNDAKKRAELLNAAQQNRSIQMSATSSAELSEAEMHSKGQNTHKIDEVATNATHRTAEVANEIEQSKAADAAQKMNEQANKRKGQDKPRGGRGR